MIRSRVYFTVLVMAAHLTYLDMAGALAMNTGASESIESNSIDDCEPRPDFVGTSTARTLSTSSQQRAERKSCIAARLRLALYLQETLSCGSLAPPAVNPASLGDSLNFVMANVPESNLSVVATNTQEVTCRVLLSDVEFTALHHLYLDKINGASHNPEQ